MSILKAMLMTLVLCAPLASAADTPIRDRSPVAVGLPLVTVHKSAYCGCCTAWVQHLRDEGFSVEVIETEAVGDVKSRVGVPPGKQSCHTAEVDGYFVEGHVPADDIRRLLRERPDARGLALPGMPVGSPGMEVPSGEVQPHTVELIGKDGASTPYRRHGG